MANDFRAAANILLIINLAAYCGIVIVFNKILNVFRISLWIKTLSLLFFIQIPAVVWFSGTKIHPDLLLGFFSILSFYFFLQYALFERNRLLNLVVSFFVLGVAFGVKYTALMYAPVLGGFVIYRCIKYSDKWFVEVLKLGSISVLCFLLGWLIFNPYVVLDFRHFYWAFLAELEHVSYGKGVNVGIPDGASPLLWMPVILKELTLTGWVLLASGVIVNIFFLIKKGNDKSIVWLALILFLFPFSFLFFIGTKKTGPPGIL